MTDLNYNDNVTVKSLLEENAKLNMAINYFFLCDPDKPTNWEYSRNMAEKLAREALKPTDTATIAAIIKTAEERKDDH
jgi:hypothetical protein